VNVAHVARLYGADVRETLALVESGFDGVKYFDRPYDELPRGLRRSLAQTVAFALPFDTYLLTDDRMYPKPRGRGRRARRRTASSELPAFFEKRLREVGFIIATEDIDFAEEHCDMALFLDQGQLHILESAQDAANLLQSRRGGRRRRRRE
jgi:capsular polysaccharide transport system ATP-binding protein